MTKLDLFEILGVAQLTKNCIFFVLYESANRHQEIGICCGY